MYRFGASAALAFAISVSAWAGGESFAGLPRSSPESAGMSSQRLERVGAKMQEYIDKGLVAGTVCAIARNGKVVYTDSRGVRDIATGAPMTEDAIFRIASMTKPITSVALMMLYEEGAFQLFDPISKWLPEFAEMNVAVPSEGAQVGTPYYTVPAMRPITVEHVLTHTAGLPNSYRGLTISAHEKVNEAASPDETVADYLQRLASLPLNFQPGEKWEYSRATCVVGRLVEVISGMTLDEFFRERIFEPLQMHDTHFFLPEEKLNRFTAQYSPGEDGKIVVADPATKESRWLRQPQIYFMGSGGLVSTAADYLRFHQMMLNGGELGGVRILSPKTVQLMTVNHTGDKEIWLRGPGSGFGLGYSVVTDQGQAQTMSNVGTYGWGGAYCTYFWVDPAEQMVAVMMTQVRPYTHLNIRQDFNVLAYQAIVE